MERTSKLLFSETIQIVRLCSPKPAKVAAAVPKLMLVQAVERDMVAKIEADLSR
jgi:hypothetical protein